MSERLTKTQRLILGAANSNRRGLVRFYAGDRRGSRIARWDGEGEDAVPCIIAYSNPEYFLKARGLLRPYGNELHLYEITDKGSNAVSFFRGRPL